MKEALSIKQTHGKMLDAIGGDNGTVLFLELHGVFLFFFFLPREGVLFH